MKNIITILLSFLVCINYCAQKKTTYKKKYDMDIPNITKEDIKISSLEDLINSENKNILKKTNDSSKLINKSAKSIGFEQNGFIGSYNDGKITSLGKITKDSTPKPNPIRRGGQKFEQFAQTSVYFYPNNNVHIIEQTLNTPDGYFNAGNWYVYDEAGNLLQHIDHEKHFKMTYYEIAQIADSYAYPATSIARFFDNKNSFWRIKLSGVQEEPIENKIVIIDDKTGKVLCELNQDEFFSFQGFLSAKKYQEDLYKLFKHD